MTAHEQLAENLLADMKPFCENATIVGADPKHLQFRVRRSAINNPASLFAEDEAKIYPFDHWAVSQCDIAWKSGARGRFWVGYVKPDIKVTIIVER